MVQILFNNGTLIISAVLFGLSYIDPAHLAFCIIVAYILFFYNILTNKFGFLKAFVWAFIAYGINLLLLLPLFWNFAYGKFRILFWFFLIFYTALNCGVWYAASNFIYKKINISKFKLIYYIIITFLFILWIDRGFLFIFDNIEGYCCFHPLVPLMEYSIVRKLLTIFGSNFLTLILLILAGFIADFLVKINKQNVSKLHNQKNYKVYYLLLLTTICPILFSRYLKISNIKKDCNLKIENLSDISHAVVEFKPNSHEALSNNMHSIQREIKKVLQLRPDTKLIIMPESTCGYSLNSEPYLLEIIKSELGRSDNNVLCILGGHTTINNGLYNSMYCINNDRIQYRHDKLHTLFLAERLCKFFSKFKLFNNLFLMNSNPFKTSYGKRDTWHLDTFSIAPYICSELFFANSCDTNCDTILCIVNDAWYITDSMKRLLFLSACHKVIDWSKSLIYCSHSRFYFVDESGKIILLK